MSKKVKKKVPELRFFKLVLFVIIMLFSKTAKKNFWFSLALTFAIIYSLLALQEAFSSDYVVQDDARQHVFWMLRFVDSSFFPNDLIAEYFQSVAPVGYSNLYRIANELGIHPFIFNKCLPLLLDIITTSYCFFFCLELFPVPFAGFLGSLFLNQYLWLRDDLVSGTPTAFIYPLLMAFLFYLVKRLPFQVWITLTLLGLFYPQGLLVAAGVLVLRVVVWRQGNTMGKQRLEIIGLIVAFFVMLLYALKSSQYQPVITAQEAKTMSEFLEGGTSEFFVSSFWKFWLDGKRSGMMPQFANLVMILSIIFAPWFMVKSKWFPLRKFVKPEGMILVELTIASIGLFSISHLLLFRLHLPSRYTEHSLRIVTSIALAFAVTIILDAILDWNQRQQFKLPYSFSLLPTVICFGLFLFHPNIFEQFPETGYVVGEYPSLYEFLQTTPKDTLIASTTKEANQLPTFAHRSILVGSQGYPVPYHLGYYQQIQERTQDLINAQYSSNLDVIDTLINQYSVDFWLLEKSAFSAEYILNSNWLMQYQPAANHAIKTLEAGNIPLLSQTQTSCQVWERKELFLLDAHCVKNQSNSSRQKE